MVEKYQTPEENSMGSDDFAGGSADSFEGVNPTGEGQTPEEYSSAEEKSSENYEFSGGDSSHLGYADEQDINYSRQKTLLEEEREEKSREGLLSKMFPRKSEEQKRLDELDRKKEFVSKFENVQRETALEEQKYNLDRQKALRSNIKSQVRQQKIDTVKNALSIFKKEGGRSRLSSFGESAKTGSRKLLGASPSIARDMYMPKPMPISQPIQQQQTPMQPQQRGLGLEQLRQPISTGGGSKLLEVQKGTNTLDRLRGLNVPSGISPIAQAAYGTIAKGNVQDMRSQQTISQEVSREQNLPPKEATNAVKELIAKRILQKGATNEYEVVQ